MDPGEQLGTEHILGIAQIAGEGRLGQVKAFGCSGQAFLVYDRDDIFKERRAQADRRRRRVARACPSQLLALCVRIRRHQGRDPALRVRIRRELGRACIGCGDGARGMSGERQVYVRHHRLGLGQRIFPVAWICQAFPHEEPGQIALRPGQGMAQGIADMQGLEHRRVQRKIDQFIAGDDVGLGDQPRAYGLMHHVIHQDDIIGLKGDHGAETGFFKQLLCQDPDAVPRSLEDEGRILKLDEPDAVPGRQRMRDWERDQELFIGERQIGHLIRDWSGPDGQIDLAVLDGADLFTGIELGQGKGDIRIPPGKGLIDAAVDDRAPVRRCGQPDQGAFAIL